MEEKKKLGQHANKKQVGTSNADYFGKPGVDPQLLRDNQWYQLRTVKYLFEKVCPI